MNLGNDKDKLIKQSLAERFPDLDDYIAAHYVEEEPSAEFADAMAFCAEEEVPAEDFPAPSKRERKTGKLFGAKQNFLGAARESTSMVAFSAAAMDTSPRPPKSLDDVVKNLDKSFMELVFTYADERGMTDVDLQKKANINRKAFSKLRCGTTKNPSKATALCFAIALELSLDETRDLLARAGLALSPCSKQDVIVQYFIEKGAYDIYEINNALFAHEVEPIGDVEA